MIADLTTYEANVLRMRKERETALQKADRGWLSLAGLFHLHDGENTFGSALGNEIVIPSPVVPARGGVFILKEGKVSVRTTPALQMLCNESSLPGGALADDQAETPDFLTIGKITLVVIQRGTQHYIRMWNTDNPARKNFTGLRFYTVNPTLCVTARFITYDTPLPTRIIDVLGNEHDVPHIGYATFQLNGQDFSLRAIGDETSLSFSFRDATNGETTYGGGRELETSLPVDGILELDFNLAHNHPCAYTNFATCPLPPKENTLPIRIEGGEMTYK